jgi:CHAD domain-containing protein
MNPHARIQTLFRKLRQLPKRIVSSPEAEAIHGLRTTIRRLETLAAATWGKPGRRERKLLKQLSRMRKQAGKVRDFDVQMSALATLRMDSISRDRVRVMRALEKKRAKRARKLVSVLADEIASGLTKRVARTEETFVEAASQARKDAHGAQDGRVARAALDRFATVVQKRGQLTEANLHDFRMDCKRVRYLAETAPDSEEAQRVVAQLERIQDAVGEWHDWVTLVATAEKVLSESPESPLLAVLRTNTQAKFLEALHVTGEVKRTLLGMRSATQPKGPAAAPASAPVARRATA